MKLKVVTDGGPWAEHNMPCSVCGDEKAVLQLWNGKYQPCWGCQRDGWKTAKIPKWLQKFLCKS